MIQEYKLTKRSQLIDLNGDFKAFKTIIHIEPVEGSKYSVSFKTQEELDSGSVEFTNVDGVYDKTVTGADNVLQNHYMILRSDSECTVKITLERSELEIEIEEHQDEEQEDEEQEEDDKPKGKKEASMSIGKILLILLVIACIGGIIYYVFYFSQKPKQGNYPRYKPNTFPVTSRSVVSRVQQAPVVIEPAIVSKPSIVDRLNNLPI